MATLPLSSIIVNRPDRQRRQLRDIESLAESISRIGLIHPPVVTRENVLVAGERRITALQSLGWTDTPVTFTDELDPGVLAVIELEENIRRHDLPWQDEVRAVRDYHNLRKSSDPKWTNDDTAAAVGMVKRVVERYSAIAAEIDKGNPLVIGAQSYSVALGLVERNNQRREAEDAFRLKATLAEPVTEEEKAHDPGAPAEPRRPVAVAPPAPVSPITQGDFHEFAPAYAGVPFNFLHCDFPYGVNADKRKQGSSTNAHGGYADSADVYWSLLDCLADNLDRLVGPSAHILFWFSMDYYSETLSFFAKRTDILVQPFPVYWHKTDNVGLLPDPKRGPRRVVETALIGTRGDRPIVQAVANCYGGPTIRDDHMSIKPEPMLAHFFRMFVDEHTRMLDPTCGSGASVIAAKSAGASSVRGLEVNPEFASRAQRRYARAQESSPGPSLDG